MSRKLERLGGRLLAKFVPTVEASAGCTPMCYGSCWQCGGRSCQQFSDCSIRCN